MTDIGNPVQYINVTEAGPQIYHKFLDDKGNRHQMMTDFQPSLFTPTNQRGCGVVSHLEKKPLNERVFRDVADYRGYTFNNRKSGNLYGDVDPMYQFIGQVYPGIIEFDISKLRFVYLDIENDYELGSDITYLNASKYAITTLAVYDSLEDLWMVFGWKPMTRKMAKPNAVYVELKSELEMMEEFVRFWQSNNFPDAVVGWNSMGYDIPYICHRLETIAPHLLEALSPVGTVKKGKRRVYVGNVPVTEDIYTIAGVNHIDFRDFYKKFVLTPRTGYSLDNIAFEEVGHNKLDFSDVGNGTLLDLYRLDYDRYVDYNMVDVELMVRINDKTRIIDVAIEMAYFCKINIPEVVSPVRSWDTLLYNYLMERGLAIEPKTEKEKEDYKGGDVRDPIPGLFDWIVSADVNSMYPNAIRWLNIGNETIREHGGENCSKSPIGVFFDKSTESTLSMMVTDLYNRRVSAKGVMAELDEEIGEIERILQERGVSTDEKN